MPGVETETSVPEPTLCQAPCWMCSQMFSPSSLAVVRRARSIPASLFCRVTQLGNGRTESVLASQQLPASVLHSPGASWDLALRTVRPRTEKSAGWARDGCSGYCGEEHAWRDQGRQEDALCPGLLWSSAWNLRTSCPLAGLHGMRPV